MIRLHIGRLREQIELQRELCERLEAIAAHFRAAEEVSADEFLKAIEGMTMIENYYTPEQMEAIKKRGEQMGEEAIRQSQVDWAELIAEVRAEKEKGTDPTDPKVQAMARRWMDLVNGFTGGDPGIAESLKRLWKEQGDNLVAQHKMENDPRDVSEYIGQAMEAVKGFVLKGARRGPREWPADCIIREVVTFCGTPVLPSPAGRGCPEGG